jgi:beta-galactosidase
MNLRPLLVVLGALTVISATPPHLTRSATEARVRYTINDRWHYASGPIDGAEAVTFADSGWSAVTLPHTWNLDDAFSKPLGYRRGIGWYRKQLVLAPALRGKRIFLHFEGANQVADVFVNGQRGGRHVGGYTAFTLDVTSLVRFAGSNLIAVRVDNRHDPNIPPLNADFTFYGGIYRDVWLIATEPVHLDLLDHGSSGVYLDTPEVSENRALVRIRGRVVNESTQRRRIEVANRIVDEQGREVARTRSLLQLAPSSTVTFRQLSPAIARPQLWSPQTPTLYRVQTEILERGRVVDRVDNPLGFRWFRIDPQRGFYLNNRPLKLMGTNRHQDYAGYGNAVPDALHRKDVQLVRATGFNFLRLAHYPQDPAVLEETDRQGLIVWEEIPVVNMIGTSDAFADHAERMLIEMVRQHYNHPSILFWGYMNEVMLVKPNPLPPAYAERVVALAKRLNARIKAEDPARATVTAVSLDEIDDGTGLQDVPDIFGLNLYFGWYYRTLQGLGPFLDSLHARAPQRPLLVSEYGADHDERIHTLSPRAFDFSTEHQQRFHESQFPQILERQYMLGSAVWNQFDFGSKGRHDSKPNLNQKGLFYFDRKPKDIASYYRARLLSEPVLHIAARDWQQRAGSQPGDETQPVIVYSNLEQVELFVGDVSLGTSRPENATARWAVALRPGANQLRARGSRGGATLEDVVVVHYVDRAPLFSAVKSLGAAGAQENSVREIAVNAGSHYQYVDAAGTVWEADREYRPGGWGYVGGKDNLIHHRIFGTNEDALFQATRDSVQSYRFDVVDGEWEVRIGLVETRHNQPGQRILQIHVNQQPIFTDLDMARDHGRYTAVERTVRVRATGGRGVTIELLASAGTTTISAILLSRH